MSIVTDDVRIEGLTQLIAPNILIEELSLSDEEAQFVVDSRHQMEQVLAGADDRLAVVVGPCSIHDCDAALEYAERLKDYADEAKEDLLLIMRVYFEKPRTTVGWKGLINDPGMDNTFDINRGLRTARQLLLDLARKGVPAGTEFLDTISPQYVADLVAWGAIGARTTESQIHRELASGLSMPVGFKNGTGGGIQIALDAIKAARSPHHFLSVLKSGATAIVNTKGNDTCHIILRGSNQGPNFDADSVAEVVERLRDARLRETIMVDCSHGNSRKDHTKQPAVAENLSDQIASGNRDIVALMIESHLKEGNQSMNDLNALDYGISVTDACVDWETTVAMLDGLREGVQRRRSS
ncbi:MAG: 3-deoxy-7-phosphoheptulonate synthase [Verrucomicrobiota bacterium]